MLTMCIFTMGFAQNEAANWFFGNQAGLSFNFGYPIPELGALIDTPEGCSTISDKLGNLQFYSDGITVWNRNNTIMQNGTNLLGDKSSTQSALIIPKPNDENIYYIFTVDDRGGPDGLRYSEVNMSLDNGLGAVTNIKNVLLANPVTEKITAIESSDGRSIWVISHKWNSNEFISFLVSDTGVNTTAVRSAVGSFHQGNINNSIGYLKASPNREKIASVKSYENNETQIFDFDASTGLLSNPITISNYSSTDLGPYGCEFSPDSNLLYVSEIDRVNSVSKIHQYDITLPNQVAIVNSDIIIAQEANKQFGALQQAIDGRIYVAVKDAQYLAVISDPNTPGLSANFDLNNVFLGGNTSQFGLPPFIQSYFFATNIFKNTCFGDNTEFSINTSTVIDAISWNFGDPASGNDNTSTDLNPTHIFTNPGDYIVTITIETEGDTQIIYRTLTISEQPNSVIFDQLINCEADMGPTSFNLVSSIPDDIAMNPNIGITFYENLTDAENRLNAINGVTRYESTLNSQIIYVRLQNIFSVDCYSISELELITISSPIIEETEAIFFCENSEDSSVTIDVGSLEGALSDYNFLWLESMETTPEITVQNQGNYTVRITPTNTITIDNPDGCFAERVVSVSSSSIATITNISVFNESNITVLNSGTGDYEYAVDNIDGPYQDSSSFSNLEPGVHTIFVRDKNECGIAQDNFAIIGFPKVFTPNGDGDNDLWQVQGLSSQFQPKSKVYIFNRYGKLLKQIQPTGTGWDGTFNGVPVSSGGYWFSVTLEDGTIYKGHFSLLR
ncbi:T9SS type B sorting domain-containing protein [Bizionia sp. M204]|nr:T9SS type B sorting domain-containing protein [Bizionia sp. M204]